MAIVHLTEGLENWPDGKVFIAHLAVCFAELGEYEQAQRTMDLVDYQSADADEKTVLEQANNRFEFLMSSRRNK